MCIRIACLLAMLLAFSSPVGSKSTVDLKAQPQEERLNDRVDTKYFLEPVPEPLRIINCTVGIGENWLEGLTIEVQNVSAQPITSFTYSVSFGRVGNEKIPVGARFHYQQDVGIDIEKGTPIRPTAALLKPGETVKLTWEDNSFERTVELIRKNGSVSKIRKATLILQSAYFQDSSVWYGGRIKDLKTGKISPQPLQISGSCRTWHYLWQATCYNGCQLHYIYSNLGSGDSDVCYEEIDCLC